jgi:NAD-dependent SIR2 family protein deacetylase
VDWKANVTQTVVIAGAGFSIPAGLPAAKDVFRRAASEEDWLLSDLIHSLDSYLREDMSVLDHPLLEHDVEEALGKLRPHVHFEPPIFPQSITLADWDAPPPPYYPQLAWRSLLLLYYFAVTGSHEPSPDSAETYAYPPLPDVYDAFVRRLPDATTFITTNYDEVIERTLAQNRRTWSYPTDGLIWRRRDLHRPALRNDRAIQICRLHGNFLWVQCRNCTLTYSLDWWAALPVGPFGQFLLFDNSRTFRCPNPECMWFPLHVVFLDFPRASWRSDIGPASTEYRKTYNVESDVLQDQWVAAAKMAEQCRTLIVVGSAVREEDEGLVALVAAAGQRASSLVVVNPDVTALKRIRSLTGKNPRWFRSLEGFVDGESNGRPTLACGREHE